MSEEPKRRTLGDYGRPYKIESCIVLPPVDAGVSFELDPSFILTSIQFRGLPSEDPNTHLYDFLSFCDIFKCDGLCDDGIRLRLFPISLRDNAKSWLYSLPARSITKWDQLATKFLTRYSPPSKLAKLRRDIINFAQFESESLYAAKERFQEMLTKCPDHELPDWQQAHIFFEGLTPANRSLLDISIGGFLRENKPKEAYDLLGELAFISYQWQHQGMEEPEKSHGALTTHSNAALSKQVESLTNALQNLVTLMQKQQSNMNDLCGQLAYLNTNCQEGNSSAHETNELKHEYNCGSNRCLPFAIARHICWCTCSLLTKAECFCTIPNIPSFNHETAPSMSIFGSSRQRIYETISSVFLEEQVAAILNSLARSGHITQDKADDAAIIYGNLLNNGLEAVVQIFCSTEGIEEKAAHLEQIQIHCCNI